MWNACSKHVMVQFYRYVQNFQDIFINLVFKNFIHAQSGERFVYVTILQNIPRYIRCFIYVLKYIHTTDEHSNDKHAHDGIFSLYLSYLNIFD